MVDDVEVVVINKEEMEDMIRQMMEQISVIRDEIENIKQRLGESVSDTTSDEMDEETNDVIEEEKGVAPEGEGGSKKEREKMDVKENEPKPENDTGVVNASVDAIKSEIVKVVREEIKKAMGDIVSTPHPDVGQEVEVRKEDNIAKGIRAILEGKMKARDFVKMIGGE